MQVTLANWRTAPFNRWAFHHVRELVPSADIPHDPARVRALPRHEVDFAGIELDGFIQATDTDGLAIVHRGRLVFERYANGMTDETPHILMSVSKSMLGILAAEVGLERERRVTDHLPELVGTSAYVTLDRLGAARAAGGMCVTLRDLARAGQWLIEERADFLQGLRQGDADAWAAGDLVPYFKGLPLRYRSQWYLLDDEAPLVFGCGIHGQHIFIDPANTIVIAKVSSQAPPLDAARIALTVRAVSRMRKLLA